MGLSNAPAAKRALYDALKAELAPVAVWHSAPNTDHPGNENVVVGKITVDQEWGSLGAVNPRRDEDIDIDVVVQVALGGTDEFACEARAWEIAAAIQTVLAADLTLGGAVRYARPSRIELEPEPFADGRLSTLALTVTCRADTH
jgi:hypothetical protein